MRKGSKQGQRIDGQAVKMTDRRFLDVAEEFLKVKESMGLSEQTLLTYRWNIKYFVQWAGEGVKCSQLTLEFILAYLDHMRERGITNVNTLNTAVQNLSPIIHYARDKGYCPHRYLMPYIRGQITDKKPYTKEELEIILEPPDKTDFVSMRTWAILWTLASTGMRARELRELRIENVDYANMLIHLQTTKNKKPRRIPMSTALFEVLSQWRQIRGVDAAEPDAPFFPTVYGEKMTTTTLSDSVREWTKARGINRTDTGGLHIFRHTFITEAVATGVSPMMLQRITGHSTLKQLGVYYHERVEDMKEVIDTITPSPPRGKKRRF